MNEEHYCNILTRIMLPLVEANEAHPSWTFLSRLRQYYGDPRTVNPDNHDRSKESLLREFYTKSRDFLLEDMTKADLQGTGEYNLILRANNYILEHCPECEDAGPRITR